MVGIEIDVRNHDGEQTVSIMPDTSLTSSVYTTESYDFDSDKILIGFKIIIGTDEYSRVFDNGDRLMKAIRKIALIYDSISDADTINEFVSPSGRKPILYKRLGGND